MPSSSSQPLLRNTNSSVRLAARMSFSLNSLCVAMLLHRLTLCNLNQILKLRSMAYRAVKQ